ncbi:MAG: zinc-dependent alcohol dehydrogenase family protein [Nitriliruptorales bacterium]|nr:zinc-dependent alcohol dehydrogenase family protein [Nitriliruptorales bacterium]
MRGWRVEEPRAIDEEPLELVDEETPAPGPGEVLLEVRTCGVCRTDLHVVEGDLPPRRDRVIPGHEVVGEVVARGDGAERFALGARVGVPWLRSTCRTCRFCRRGDENLCIDPEFTGWTHDGGYAEAIVVPEAYLYELPPGIDDLHAAPLLCAGIIGYRALKRSELPPGGKLGIYGFGGSAHLAAQLAIAAGAALYVVTRSDEGQELARELGATWAGGAGERPPEPLDSAILFAPVGDIVPDALAAMDRGGTLAIAGIHLTDIPSLDYERHLFQERQVRSVTANTRADGEEFLRIAERIGIEVTATPYPFEEAPQALADLAHDRFAGAAVLDLR